MLRTVEISSTVVQRFAQSSIKERTRKRAVISFRVAFFGSFLAKQKRTKETRNKGWTLYAEVQYLNYQQLLNIFKFKLQ